jgi:hypothetical protein
MGPKTTKDDQPQNPYMNGQGMLITLTPVDRWYDQATFRSPTDIDNFIYLTFRYADRENIYFDNQKISAYFGGSIKTINGTEYAYITAPVAAADHNIEGRNGVLFAGYAYGNWDREKDGFAYGYNLGANFATPCDDSIYITDNINCGHITGKAIDVNLQLDPTCASIFSYNFKLNNGFNFTFLPQAGFKSGDKTFNYEFQVINIHDSASATIEVMTRSGRIVRKTYNYYPEDITPSVTFIDYGLMELNKTICHSFDITNTTQVPVTITELSLKSNSVEFAITPIGLPITLQPNETKSIEVCATALTQSLLPVRDSLIVKMSCYDKTIVGLQLSTGEPDIYISDAYWGPIPVNMEKAQIITIENRGIINAELYSIDWTDHIHFSHTDFPGTPTSPLVINPGGQYSFNVYYKPDEGGVLNTDSASFQTNSTKTKLFSLWNGSGPLELTLIAPPNQSRNNPINVRLDWTDMGKNFVYNLLIATDQSFANIEKDTITNKIFYNSNLAINSIYYWKVLPVHNGSNGIWSISWEFETDTSIAGVENDFYGIDNIELYPNPANSNLTIQFNIDKPLSVSMVITNLFGEDIIRINNNQFYEAGKYTLNVRTDDLQPGMYIVVCKIGESTKGIKFLKVD